MATHIACLAAGITTPMAVNTICASFKTNVPPLSMHVMHKRIALSPWGNSGAHIGWFWAPEQLWELRPGWQLQLRRCASIHFITVSSQSQTQGSSTFASRYAGTWFVYHPVCAYDTNVWQTLIPDLFSFLAGFLQICHCSQHSCRSFSIVAFLSWHFHS